MLLYGGRLSRSHNLIDMQSPSQKAAPSQNATIAHVGIAVSTLDAGVSFYRDILGMNEVPMQDSDGARIAAFDAGGSLVELLAAESPDSPIGKFVAKRGPGIHHVCFAVDDLEGALARCRAHGLRLIDESPGSGPRANESPSSIRPRRRACSSS